MKEKLKEKTASIFDLKKSDEVEEEEGEGDIEMQRSSPPQKEASLNDCQLEEIKEEENEEVDSFQSAPDIEILPVPAQFQSINGITNRSIQRDDLKDINDSSRVQMLYADEADDLNEKIDYINLSKSVDPRA